MPMPMNFYRVQATRPAAERGTETGPRRPLAEGTHSTPQPANSAAGAIRIRLLPAQMIRSKGEGGTILETLCLQVVQRLAGCGMEVVRPWIRVEGSFPVELTPLLSNGVRTLAAMLIRMLDPPNQANIKLSIDISRSSSFFTFNTIFNIHYCFKNAIECYFGLTLCCSYATLHDEVIA
jgi:hypothetical protein